MSWIHPARPSLTMKPMKPMKPMKLMKLMKPMIQKVKKKSPKPMKMSPKPDRTNSMLKMKRAPNWRTPQTTRNREEFLKMMNS